MVHYYKKGDFILNKCLGQKYTSPSSIEKATSLLLYFKGDINHEYFYHIPWKILEPIKILIHLFQVLNLSPSILARYPQYEAT